MEAQRTAVRTLAVDVCAEQAVTAGEDERTAAMAGWSIEGDLRMLELIVERAAVKDIANAA